MEEKNRKLLRELPLPIEEERNLFNFIKVGVHILFIFLVALSIFLFLFDIRLQNRIDEQRLEIEKCQKEINFLLSEINTSLLLQSIEGQSSIIDEISSVEYTSVMLLGGEDGRSAINSTIIYNSLKKTWDVCQPSLPTRLFEHGAAVLNDEIYIFGGIETTNSLSSVYKLSEDKNWIKMADMKEAKCCMRMSSVVFGSEIWVIGGRAGGKPLSTVEKYNPKTNSWTKMPGLNWARQGASATVIDGKIYVSGGYSGNFMKSMEVFDPAKNIWEIFIDLPLGLSDHSSIAKGRSLMIAGGRKNFDGLSNELWKINITDPKKEWIKMPNFKKERRHHGFVELEDGLMVVGGLQNGNVYINSVEVFDGINWKDGNNLLEDRGVFGFTPLTRKQEEKFLQRFCNSAIKIRH